MPRPKQPLKAGNPRPSLNLNEQAAPAPGKYCPKCYLSEADLGKCGNFALGCPEPLAIDPEKVVELKCGPCDKRLSIPIGDLLKRRFAGLERCTLDECAAVILPPVASKSPVKKTPPAVTE